jgi:anti-sigma factor RsiW
MRRSQERVNRDMQLLHRYVDREMSPDERESFRARLAESAALRRELLEMQRVGMFVRRWASTAEARAEGLVEPTLARIRHAERKRSRHGTLGYAVLVALLAALPWSRRPPELGRAAPPTVVVEPTGAAIERLEAVDKQAQVFVVGASSTPVVWLADDVPDEDVSDQDPG